MTKPSSTRPMIRPLRTQPRAADRAPHRRQRDGTAAYRRARACGLWSRRDRVARHLQQRAWGGADRCFIHGGAWRSGRSKDFAGPAEMFLRDGAHYVVPDFAWVQDVGGNLMVLADQVRRAVAWIHENIARFGGDPNRLYIGGQSSGGHLAAVALTTDWQCQFGLPADLIKGGMCISGMYDLAPVRLSARNRYVRFDDATVAALSPIRYLDRLRAPLVVAYGTRETPEFQRQNREFAAAVEAAGKRVRLVVGEHYNHFELPETLGNPYGLLGRAAL